MFLAIEHLLGVRSNVEVHYQHCYYLSYTLHCTAVIYFNCKSCHVFFIQKKTAQMGSVGAQPVLSLLVKSSPPSGCGVDPCLRGQFWQLWLIYIEATNLEPCPTVGRKWGRGKNYICVRNGNYLYFICNLVRPLQVASKPIFLSSSVSAVQTVLAVSILCLKKSCSSFPIQWFHCIKEKNPPIFNKKNSMKIGMKTVNQPFTTCCNAWCIFYDF